MATKTIEWMCTHCGKRERHSENFGRPMPGTCAKKINKGPHTWVKNRET